MSLSKNTQKKILSALRLADDAIQALVDDDAEHDIDISKEIVVLTAAELTGRDSSKYNEGKEAGVETAIKDYKKANNLDFKGKTLHDLQEYLAANSEDAEAVKKLGDDVATLTAERDTVKDELAAMRLQTRLHAWIPVLNNNMNKAEALSVMQANGFDFKEEEGVVVAYRHGNRVTGGDAEEPTTADMAIRTFFETEKKWVGDADANNSGKTGGGGGNSSTKARPMYAKTSDVEKAFNARYGAGASMGTEHDFAGHLQKIMKEAEAAGTPLIMD